MTRLGRSAEPSLQELKEGVTEQSVHLLNARRRCGGYAQTKVAPLAHLSPGRTRQANDMHFAAAGSLYCTEDVGAVSTSGNREEHVAGAPVGLNLAGEGTLKSVVVDNGKRGAGPAP